MTLADKMALNSYTHKKNNLFFFFLRPHLKQVDFAQLRVGYISEKLSLISNMKQSTFFLKFFKSDLLYHAEVHVVPGNASCTSVSS